MLLFMLLLSSYYLNIHLWHFLFSSDMLYFSSSIVSHQHLPFHTCLSTLFFLHNYRHLPLPLFSLLITDSSLSPGASLFLPILESSLYLLNLSFSFSPFPKIFSPGLPLAPGCLLANHEAIYSSFTQVVFSLVFHHCSYSITSSSC